MPRTPGLMSEADTAWFALDGLGNGVERPSGQGRATAFPLIRFLDAVRVEPMMVACLFRGRSRWPRKRAVVPSCLDEAVEPSKIPISRTRMATTGMAAQKPLNHFNAMPERDVPGDPPLHGVIKREGRAQAIPGVQIADPAAERGEVNIADRRHRSPSLTPTDDNRESAHSSMATAYTCSVLADRRKWRGSHRTSPIRALCRTALKKDLDHSPIAPILPGYYGRRARLLHRNGAFFMQCLGGTMGLTGERVEPIAGRNDDRGRHGFCRVGWSFLSGRPCKIRHIPVRGEDAG